MTEIDLQLVREFFELNRFQVATHWHQHDAVENASEGGIQIYVENARPEPSEELDPVLHPADLPHIRRAVVEIRAWHTDRFYSSLIDSNPVVAQFAEPWALGPARDYFGTDDFKTIIVISELPRTPEQRIQALQRLKRTGIDHLIEFPTILQSLAEKVQLSGSYSGSPTLQMLQILKRYRFLRNQQMEFVFTPDAPPPAPRVRSEAESSNDDSAP